MNLNVYILNQDINAQNDGPFQKDVRLYLIVLI